MDRYSDGPLFGDNAAAVRLWLAAPAAA